MGKIFCIGDIHGRIEALKEVLTLSKFDYEKDRLIVLGDIVDGGYNTYDVVEELLKINDVIFVLGNHDIWWLNHMASGWADEIWTSQGGKNTIKSYGGKIYEVPTATEWIKVITQDVTVPVTHQDFFNRGLPYYVEDNMLFIHGGFNARLGKKVGECNQECITWDRDLIEFAKEGNIIPGYKYVFVGHTTTQSHGEEKPIQFENLFMLDCGAGWNGKLAIMDIHTKEYWLSKRQTPAR